MKTTDLILTAAAPAIWGSTYLVTSEMLPATHPITLAGLRALPSGLVLLLLVRQLPPRDWYAKVIALSLLNIGIFWPMLFIAAQRLPGGQAATLGAIQPLIVIILARWLLATRILPMAIVAAGLGIVGVALLVLSPGAQLDPLGLLAALAGTMSMALGTVLYRRWSPPVSPTVFTAWQLTIGGSLLCIIALLFEPPTLTLNPTNLIAIGYLGFIGAGLTLIIWQRGLTRLPPAIVSTLGLLSPTAAVILGWVVLNQTLTPKDWGGIGLILLSVWLCQRAYNRSSPMRKPPPEPSTTPRPACVSPH